MKKKLFLIISLTVSITLILSSCSQSTESNKAIKTESEYSSVQSVDTGGKYIDSFIFIGESTTYHLKSRGVLSDGTNTTQVWSPPNATINLDTTISSLKIVYPPTSEELTISEAAARAKPQRILLTFGLNGAVTKVKKGESYFTSCYMSLISAIRSASPSTQIIIHSCFPIAESMDMSNYNVDSKTLNAYISTLNEWAKNMAHNENLQYVDTWSALTDEKGFLLEHLHVGDGHHLTAEAYNRMLEVLEASQNTEDI